MIENKVDILYESENYIIVNKPYDMYIDSNDLEEKNTLISRLEPKLQFVHRLDYATSGAICLGKSKRATAAAGRCFERRTARKYYLAVVRGHISTPRMDIKYDVGEDTSNSDIPNLMRAVSVESDVSVTSRRRSAHTRLAVVQTGYYDGDPATVVVMKPYTGRRHQLRVHCAAICHPIVGDYTYSNRTDDKPHRMFLHALRLCLPIVNEVIDVETQTALFQDDRFLSAWSSDRAYYNMTDKGERTQVYNLLDSPDFTGKDYGLRECLNAE